MKSGMKKGVPTDRVKGETGEELISLRRRVAELEEFEHQCRTTLEALREHEEKYRSIFDDSLDAIYYTSRDG
ncbi:MAG TPA: hypothetical protein VN260_01200, partial [Dissulfurispiraceae bacterium]|nr:hypothetical protein [Dissulfurispiraceae bacterium]